MQIAVEGGRTMDVDLHEHIEKLERSLAIFKSTAKEAFGFLGEITYNGIKFDVSRRFVMADLSPLAFFHLVEHVDQEDPSAAVERLYYRLLPLLSCRHKWTPLKRASDQQVRSLAGKAAETGPGPYICKNCTAYVLGEVLPVLGRD